VERQKRASATFEVTHRLSTKSVDEFGVLRRREMNKAQLAMMQVGP
jgi:hypothetical protein